MTFRPELIEELLKDYQNPEDLMGESGILKQLTKALILLANSKTDQSGDR
ncbi:MAG: hypothetical protein AAFR77_09870 [Cyanobacteria bacterium J06631_2]